MGEEITPKNLILAEFKEVSSGNFEWKLWGYDARLIVVFIDDIYACCIYKITDEFDDVNMYPETMTDIEALKRLVEPK